MLRFLVLLLLVAGAATAAAAASSASTRSTANTPSSALQNERRHEAEPDQPKQPSELASSAAAAAAAAAASGTAASGTAAGILFRAGQERMQELKKRRQDVYECDICELVLFTIDSFITAQSTEQQIAAVVAQVCQYVPAQVFNQCTDFIQDFGPEIITLLVQQTRPRVVCVLLGCCPADNSTLAAGGPGDSYRVGDPHRVSCAVLEFFLNHTDLWRPLHGRPPPASMILMITALMQAQVCWQPTSGFLLTEWSRQECAHYAIRERLLSSLLQMPRLMAMQPQLCPAEKSLPMMPAAAASPASAASAAAFTP